MPIVSTDSPTIDTTATTSPKLATEEQTTEATPVRSAADEARTRASEHLAAGRYLEARKALEEAEHLDAEPLKARAQRIIGSIRSHIPKMGADQSKIDAVTAHEPAEPLSPIDKSMSTVSLYSKIAAGVGLLPGGLLNFAGILAVQVTMVWKIANNFGHSEGKERIRGSILSLIGAAVPTTIGHGAGIAIAAIPALLAGTVVYFIVTPVLAYAMTQAIGNAFIMHFESGGTLLSFDPKAFENYFLKEFKRAGGTLKSDETEMAEAVEAAKPTTI